MSVKLQFGRLSILHKGDYDPTTLYEKLDIVTYNNDSYICILSCTNILPTNTTYWKLMVKSGKSAYDLYVEKTTNEGLDPLTLEAWLNSLKGEPGTNGNDGQPGTDGKSAYDIAVKNGFNGTEVEWLASLHGQDGQQGAPGSNGTDGITPRIDPTTKHWIIGDTDTNILAEGTNGQDGQQGPKGDPFTYGDFTTEQLEALKGPKGDKGDTGTVDLSVLADYATIAALNALSDKIDALELKMNELHPAEEEKPSFKFMTTEPTTENISENLGTTLEMPQGAQTVDLTSLDEPTYMYLVFPQSWELIENDLYVKPIILDSLGNQIGFSINEDTPTIIVNNITYRVLDIRLGKGVFTIEF